MDPTGDAEALVELETKPVFPPEVLGEILSWLTIWHRLKGFVTLKTLMIWEPDTSEQFAPDHLDGINEMPAGLHLSFGEPPFRLDPSHFHELRVKLLK